MARPRKSTPKPGSYADGGYPASEHLTSMNEGHGFKVGDRVEFVKDFADDVPAGRRGVVERIDNHPTMPITVFVHHPAGAGYFFTPVKPDEIAKVDDEQPAEAAQTAPDATQDDEQGEAAPVAA